MTKAHLRSIGSNVLNVRGAVSHGRVVCALGSDFGETGHLERETLAVRNMPMKLAHLRAEASDETFPGRKVRKRIAYL